MDDGRIRGLWVVLLLGLFVIGGASALHQPAVGGGAGSNGGGAVGHYPVVDVPGQGSTVIINGEAIPVSQLVAERDALQAQLQEYRQNKGARLSQCLKTCQTQCHADVNGQEDTLQARIDYYNTLMGQ